MLDLVSIGNQMAASIRLPMETRSSIWLVMALILAGKACFAAGSVRWVLLILAVGFLIFSFSDVIESRTGAWWNPPGLLVMKGGCIAVFVLGFWKYHRLTKTTKPS